MGRQNIYKTLSGASFMPPSTIENLIDFLVANRGYLLAPDKKNDAFKTRFFNHTILGDLVYRLIASGGDKIYSLIRLPSKTVSLHEAMDLTFIPVDLLQMKEMTPSSIKTLSLIPDLNDKIVINITDITKSTGEFADVSRFYHRVVRDFLCRHYYNSNTSIWISTALVRYVAKVYSMTIGGRISGSFDLSVDVQSFIQTVFCAFFVCKMTSVDVAETFLKTNARGLGIPDGYDLQQILGLMKETLGEPVPQTLDDVFKVINALDHTQLKSKTGSRLDRAVLNSRFVSLAPEAPVATLALEYPPYFVYLILLVLSGERIGLTFTMKNAKLVNEGKEIFETIIKTPTFLSIS